MHSRSGILVRPFKCEVAQKGEVNRNFVVTTKLGKYVLREILSHSHYGSSSDLEFELSYLNYFKKAGFPYQVPLAIPTITGKTFTIVSGRYFWLYRFIEGTVLARLDESHLDQLAKMISTYHHLLGESSLDNRKPAEDLYGRTYTLNEIIDYRAGIDRKRRINREDATFLEESGRLIPLLNSLDASPYSRLERYPIHRDIIPENLIWKAGELVGVLDFEHVSSTNEPTVKDVAVTLQFTCRDRKARYQLDMKLARRFLDSYRKWHALSETEVRLIPDLISSGFVEDFVWAYWMLNNDPGRAGKHALRKCSAAARWSFANGNRITRALSK